MKNKLVHYEIFIFDLSKMFKTMNIHFKQPFQISDNVLKKFDQNWSADFRDIHLSKCGEMTDHLHTDTKCWNRQAQKSSGGICLFV